MKERKIIETMDNGRPLVRTALGKRQEKFCEIWKDDYEFLRRLGLSRSWDCIPPRDYILAPAPQASGNHVLVARVLLNAGPNQRVRYLDGDRLNLRRENLQLIESKGTKRRDRDLLTKVIS